MKFTIALIIATVATVAALKPKFNGYDTTCGFAALVEHNNHTALRAICETSNTTQCSILDLNNCFEWRQSNSNIMPKDKGGFGRYANHCRLLSDGTTMTCQILRDIYKLRDAFLEDTISNDGGRLRCFDNLADTPPDCATREAFPSEAQALYLPWTMLLVLLVIILVLNQ
ncbi:hypothetical protein F5Y04DRAFT_286350 [Hypomontagnella monticulosa]|nr:hypothetical protein F5Y04DRAFT_286350 [Hypomontagnella monticulosa]